VAPGLDPSWQSGLAEAFAHHLQWGPQVVFSFGPYGFVDTLAPFYRTTALVAVLFALGVSWGLAALVVSALRPSWGLLAAAVAAWAVLGVANGRTGYADLASAVSLGLALGVLWAASPVRRTALVGLLGVVSGFLLLVKFNDALVSVGLLAVAAASQVFVGGLRALGRCIGVGALSMVATFSSAWAAASQSFSNLPSYFRGSWAVAAGYSSAMGLSTGRRAEDVFAAVGLGLLAVVYCAAASSLRARLGAKVCLAVGLVGWSWAALKEGFVRHDEHDLTFFGLSLLALGLARVRRQHLWLQGAALVVTACFFGLAAGDVPPELRSPGASASAVATELKEVLGLGGFSRSQQRLRSELLAAGNSLPRQVLKIAVGHSVAIVPSDEALAYVYQRLNWDPEPVLQGYSAYTSYLDRLDASFLASTRAPALVVYEPYQVIDGRDPWMGPPAALEAMYCHYAQIGAVGSWQVLARAGGRGRCGPAHLTGRVTARFGEAVKVPPSRGEMVAATFSLGLPLSYGLAAAAMRPPAVHLEVWAAGARRPVTYRFVPGTAADLHVLVTPPALGYSASFTPPTVQKLAITGGAWAPGQGRVTVAFYSIRLQPTASRLSRSPRRAAQGSSALQPAGSIGTSTLRA
jgi:hypothetical protein